MKTAGIAVLSNIVISVLFFMLNQKIMKSQFSLKRICGKILHKEFHLTAIYVDVIVSITEVRVLIIVNLC